MEWNGIFTNFPDSSTKPGFVSNYTTTFDVHQNGWSTIGGIWFNEVCGKMMYFSHWHEQSLLPSKGQRPGNCLEFSVIIPKP